MIRNSISETQLHLQPNLRSHKDLRLRFQTRRFKRPWVRIFLLKRQTRGSLCNSRQRFPGRITMGFWCSIFQLPGVTETADPWPSGLTARSFFGDPQVRNNGLMPGYIWLCGGTTFNGSGTLIHLAILFRRRWQAFKRRTFLFSGPNHVSRQHPFNFALKIGNGFGLDRNVVLKALSGPPIAFSKGDGVYVNRSKLRRHERKPSW